MSKFFLVHDTARRMALKAVQEAPSGFVVNVSEPKRTDQQSRKMHAMIDDVAAQVEWYGAKRTPKAWKRIFAAALFDHDLIPGLNPGSLVLVERKTSEMGVKEMGLMIDLIDAFGAQHGVVFREREAA